MSRTLILTYVSGDVSRMTIDKLVLDDSERVVASHCLDSLGNWIDKTGKQNYPTECALSPKQSSLGAGCGITLSVGEGE